MARVWTQEQLDAIRARRGTVLVSAAAGSGKTSVLSERVIERILDESDPCDADALLVVTFTKAAAAEMRQRISQRLTAILTEDPFNEHLQRQKLALERAHISTIHSFCGDLIRGNFHKLGISPSFRIASESEMTVLRDQAVQEVLERMYAQREDTPGFTDLVELLGSARDDRHLSETILQLYDFIRSTAFPERWLKRMTDAYNDHRPVEETVWGKFLLRYAGMALEYALSAAEELQHVADEDGEVFAAYSGELHNDVVYLQQCRECAKTGDWDGLVERLQNGGFGTLPRAKKGASDDVKKRVQDGRNAVKELVKKIKEQFPVSSAEATEEIFAQRETAEVLRKLVQDLWQELEERKQEKNLLDYGDLEHFALKLLVRPTEEGYERTAEAEELAESFREVMIDEYQDTNEAQDMIFSAVSREEGNLFLVGDVKQSIYRFRQAMPELFIRRRGAYPLYRREEETYPATVILGRNFRSRKGITDGVNFIFSQIMSEEMGEIEYNEEEALICGAEYPPSETPDVSLQILDGDSEEEDAADNDVLEARRIAEIIREKIARGDTVTENGQERPVTYRDFCVLLGSLSRHGNNYLKEFTHLGIPAWSGAQSGFFTVREIRMLLSLLRVIDNPIQDVPLLATMMSPMYGFTPDDMAEYRKKLPRGSLYLAVKRAAEDSEKVRGFLAEIEEFRRLAATMPADRLLRKIYEKKHCYAMVRVMKNGELRTANLRCLLEYAREYERGGYQGLSGFIRYIDRLQEQRSDLAPAAVASETANVVRIMSIHHSKGLEFPVVFLAGCAVQFNKQDLYRDLLIHPHLAVGLKRRDPQTAARYRTAAYEAVKLAMERDDLSERLRVLYVALTRAKEKIYLLMTLKKPEEKIANFAAQLRGQEPVSPFVVMQGKKFSDWLILTALRHPNGQELRACAGEGNVGVLPCESPWEIRVLHPKASQTEETTETIAERAEFSPERVDFLRERIGFAYPFAHMTQIPTKLAVSEVSEQAVRSQYVAAARPAFLSAKGLTPAERGTALHKFMQFSDYVRGKNDPAEELARMVRLGYLTGEEGGAVEIGKLQKFFSGGLAGRMFEALRQGNLHREVRFTMELPVREYDAGSECDGEGIVVQGVADCVMEEADGLVIVDYKTDRVTDGQELIDRYAGQLEMYARAMEKCFHRPVKEHILYSFALGKEVKISVEG